MADKKLIAVLPGDGIGPEVIAQATRVLELLPRPARPAARAVARSTWAPTATCATGRRIPKEVRARIASEASAVLLGALGDPRVPGLEHARDILFGLRFGLDLYANVRPVPRARPTASCR